MASLIENDGKNNKEGIVKKLTDNLFAVCSNNKWGVVNQSEKQIVNFLYDAIEIVQNHLIVTTDNRVGVLDENGSIIMNPSYNNRKCFH